MLVRHPQFLCRAVSCQGDGNSQVISLRFVVLAVISRPMPQCYISIQTRVDEIYSYANSLDPNKRALAGDPGHLTRLENEAEALERCKDECEKNNKPDFGFDAPPEWGNDPNIVKTLSWGTAVAATWGFLGEVGWIFLF